MPVMMLMEWTGVTAAQYDEICRQVNWEGDRPPGGLFHIAAATPTGLRSPTCGKAPSTSTGSWRPA